MVSTEDEGSERAIIMRYQGFIHPATLVPEELEYNKGYEARMSKLNEKFKDLEKVAPKITSRTTGRRGGRAILQEEKKYSPNLSSLNTKSKTRLKNNSNYNNNNKKISNKRNKSEKS